MRFKLVLLFVICSFAASAQKKDTVIIHDTIPVIIVLNKADTMKVEMVYYEGKYMMVDSGNMIITGDYSLLWATKENTSGARNQRQNLYDNKFKPFTKKIYSLKEIQKAPPANKPKN